MIKVKQWVRESLCLWVQLEV